MIEQHADKKSLNVYDYYIYETSDQNLILYRYNKENNITEYMIDPSKVSEENFFFDTFIELLMCKSSETHEWAISAVSNKTMTSVDKFTYIGNLNG